MIVDTHVHFTEPERPGRPHAPDGNPMDHLLVEELLAHAHAAGIDRIVQVTPSTMGYDNTYSFEAAERYADDVVGVIARIDPVAPGALDALTAMMDQPKMLGVRLTLITPASERWLSERTLDPFLRGAQRLGCWVELFAPFRVDEMHATVKRFGGVRWLIDHMGLRYYAGRDNRDAYRQWPELLALAVEPNVWIKCSYFPEASKDLESYPYPLAQQYLRRLVEAASAERLVWGSNFPPVKRACTYLQTVDFIRRECAFLSPDERAAILGGNFMRYFGPGSRASLRGSPA